MALRRLLVTLTLAALLPLATAGAFTAGDERDGRCDGRQASRFEYEVAYGLRFRSDFGLPAEPAYVEAVTKDRRNRDPNGELPPLTPPERRYMRDRENMPVGRVSDYVNRHARAISGGISIEDDYPRGAYVRVRLTRALDRHAGPLGRLGVRIQIVQVRYTEAELDRARDNLGPKVGALAREGIAVLGWSTDIDLNAVDVEYVSARPDAHAVVIGRLGPLVHPTPIATTPYYEVCVRARTYRVSRSDRTLRIGWRTFRAYRFARLEVRETRRTVRVAVIERAPYGVIRLLGKAPTALVRLQSRLGNRHVIDAETGRRLHRRKPARARAGARAAARKRG